jgi:heptosyltransferase-2
VPLARRHLHPLLRLLPKVSEVLERGDSDPETIQRMRRARCQEAILLPNSFHVAWLAWRAGIPYRWGYRDLLRMPLLHPGIPRSREEKRHQIFDYRRLVEALGVPEPESWVPRIGVPEELEAFGRQRLQRASLPSSGPLVGLFAGAEFGPSKRWPWRRFAALARALRRSVPGLSALLLAGPKEVWSAVRIHEESGKIHPVIGPELDLAELTGVLAQLDLLITNDSGPMHLAAAVGVPCLALFGPTDPGRTAPSGEHHRVIYTDRWCSPCFRRRCPLLRQKCLKGIGVEEVSAAAQEMIGGLTRARRADPHPPRSDPARRRSF